MVCSCMVWFVCFVVAACACVLVLNRPSDCGVCTIYKVPLYYICFVFVCGCVYCVFSCGCVSLAMCYVMLNVVFCCLCLWVFDVCS